MRAERILEARVEPAPERAAAADEVLPRTALRLVDGKGDAAVERRPGKRAGERVTAAIAVREKETDPIAAGESIFLRLSQTD